jgi:hypothetical protein
MLKLVTQRLEVRIGYLQKELRKRSQEALSCRDNDIGFQIGGLPFELIIDLDSFLFESRAAYELTGKFLRKFFSSIFERSMKESTIVQTLANSGLDTEWITKLREARHALIHDVTGWPALEVVDEDPTRFELVLLMKNVDTLEDPKSFAHFEDFRAIQLGLWGSLEEIENWLMNEIASFEQGEKESS